jgi:hypothetical protein
VVQVPESGDEPSASSAQDEVWGPAFNAEKGDHRIMTCDKHKSEVCESCAYERGLRKALEIARDNKPEDVIERLEEHLKEIDESSDSPKGGPNG